MARPDNYFHKKLIETGQCVVKDEAIGLCHLYHFDCGCLRSYSISIWGDPSESLQPCGKHRGLIEEAQDA